MIYLSDFRCATASTKTLMEDIKYPQHVHWCPDTYERLKMGLFYAPHRMADKVIDHELARALREDDGARTGFILASGNSHFAGINPLPTPDNGLKYQFKVLPLSLTNVYAGRTAQAFGTKDHVSTDATACASGLKVLMDVQSLFHLYEFDRVVVLAIEDQITNLTLNFFGESGACLAWKDEQTGILPSAFDRINQGFHVGQGACLAVFENEATVNRRGITPRARLLGAYTASEACANAIGQSDNGEGFMKAARHAMRIAETAPADIDVIKTHGTGTKSNNESEGAAISGIFGHSGFMATSYKQKIGHTMGVSGLLETCLLLDDIQNGFVPGIENRTEDDEVYLSQDTDVDNGQTILSLAAGMGNVYSAVVLTTEF
jgi:3-oxoacyl-(acyl-carrier-protein) synthase